LLDCAISHGPNVQNFTDDYAAFQRANAATLVHNADDLANTLLDREFLAKRVAANQVSERGRESVKNTALRLIGLIPEKD